MTIMEKIKLLIKIRKPASQLAEEIEKSKDKYKTISFWMTILLGLSACVASVEGMIPPKIGLISTIALGCIYNILRAIKNAQIEGVTPAIHSTRFWVGILSIISAALIALQSGGISSEWLKTSVSIMGGIMAIAQALGTKQPDSEIPVDIKIEETPKAL